MADICAGQTACFDTWLCSSVATAETSSSMGLELRREATAWAWAWVYSYPTQRAAVAVAARYSQPGLCDPHIVLHCGQTFCGIAAGNHPHVDLSTLLHDRLMLQGAVTAAVVNCCTQ